MEKNIWKIKGRVLNMDRPLIMGIVNVTPDSFYDGGKYPDKSRAVERALILADEKADIIDIGGESSRPGSSPVNETEEIERVIPVIEEVTDKIDIPVSCDTYKSKVAGEAVKAGAEIINDISAFSMDKKIFDIIKTSGCGYVLMHMQGTPGNMQKEPFYQDVIKEIKEFFSEKISYMTERGMDKNRIVIDPGIGFGKRTEDNLKILKNLHGFEDFRRPLLIGVSRKSFIGKITGLPSEERLEGSIASSVIAYLRGAGIFRTHDVKQTRRALEIAHAIEGVE
jgi:dihydropteroate synthase